MTALAIPASAASTAPRAASSATIHMHDFAFVPKTLTIDAGTRVTIVNDDDEAHTATAIDASFDTAGLDAHETWSHVFDRIGSFAYYCELHPSMKGVIIVRTHPASKGHS